MKSGKRSLRTLVTIPLATLVVVGLLSAIPASASHVGTSANLTASDQQILAGGVRAFTLTINHPTISNCGTGVLQVPCPDGVNYIEIVSPDGRGDAKDPTRQFAVQSASTNLSGWQANVVPGSFGNVPRRVKFTTTGNGLLGGGTFTVTTTVPILGADLSKAWTVKVSTNGGNTQSEASGNLTTIVRVLRVTTLTLVGPDPAVGTGRVTGLQTGIEVACAVENLGSIPISVTPELTSPGFTQVSSSPETEIPAGGSLTFDPPFELTAQNVSSRTNRVLTCDGDGTSVEGGSTTTSFNNRQLTIPVEPPALFDYVKVVRPPTFSPRALPPLSSATFLATLRKNPGHSPAVDLDGSATVLHFSSEDGSCTLDIPLGASINVPAGSLSQLVLSFGPEALPECMDADVYDVTMSLAGTDVNGAPVSFPSVPGFEETLTIDAGIPAVENLGIAGVLKPSNFTCTAPCGDPERQGYNTIERAGKNGTAVPFSGNVTDNLDPATAERQACAGGPGTGDLQPGECRILEARVFQYSDVDGTLLIPQADIECPAVTINSSGNITGSCTTTFHAEARSIRAQVSVEDAVGQPGTGNSQLPESSFDLANNGRLQLDNETPVIATVETQRYEGAAGEEAQNRLVVTLNECVSIQGGSTGGLVDNTNNWRPDGNQVDDVDGPNCPSGTVSVGDPDGRSTIVLTTRDDYPDDGPHGMLLYNPNCQFVCDGSSYLDRVSRAVAKGTNHPIIDRIAPKLPVIAGVSVGDGRELALQDSEFFTNTLTPEFRLVNPADQMDRAVFIGYRAEIWEETNSVEGLQMAGATPDALRGSEVVDGDRDCQAGELPGDPEFSNCEVVVPTDFGPDHVEAGETAVTVYAVTKDTLDESLGGPNLSPTADEVLNLDFNVPILQSVLAEADRVLVTFSEDLLSGRNFAADWGVWNSSFSDMTVASVSLVAGQPTQRALDINDSAYVPEETALIEYIYFGPDTGDPDQIRYEDRATNKTVTPQATCLPAGVSAGLC